MGYTLAELAAHVGGTVVGNPDAMLTGVAALKEAGAGDLSFLANPKYTEQLAETQAAAVLVSRAITEAPCALLQVDNPDLAFSQAADLLLPPTPGPAAGVHPTAVVAESATLGADVSIGACVVIAADAMVGAGCVIYPGTYIGHGATVGDGCILYPNVVLYHAVRLGTRVIVHAGAVIGSDGFGYAWDGQNHVKIRQAGTVELGDDVEIGAGTTVDRARFGTTVIGPGTKLDNQIQIAHNVHLGAKCAFAAQVGISGSVQIGNGVLMGGQSAVAGHVEIGDGAIFSGKSGVTKNLPGGVHYSGYPARPHKAQIDEWRNLKALPRMREQVRALEARIAELEKRDDSASVE